MNVCAWLYMSNLYINLLLILVLQLGLDGLYLISVITLLFYVFTVCIMYFLLCNYYDVRVTI